MSMSKLDIDLLITAFARLESKLREEDGKSPDYGLIAIPRYSQTGYNGSDNHDRIEAMVVVGDYYYGKKTFLLYQSGSLQGSFDFSAVEAMFLASQVPAPKPPKKRGKKE